MADDFAAFFQMVSSTETREINRDEWITKLKIEAMRLNHVVVTQDLFSNPSVGSSATLTHKSKKVVEMVAQRLAESLKLELSDSRRIIDNQRTRLKDLENEKEELLQTSHWLNENESDHLGETFEFLNTILSYKKTSININTVPIASSQRSIQIAKRMIGNFNDNLTTVYEKTTTRCNEISDLHERITFLTEQLKSMTVRTECFEDEFHALKKTSEQTEINYRCVTDELKTTQTKLRRVEEERNMYLDENMELKNLRIQQGNYGNLNHEKEKLLKRIKEIETERDALYEEVQEQIKRNNLCASECKELEYKREELEHTITKLKREYVDITAEMSRVSHENEEIKKSVLDSERQRTVLKRDIKSLETSNKDLEDQLFHLTTENEKNKNDYEKITTSLQQYNTMVMELEEKLTICERDILLIENDLKKERAEKSDLEETNKHLRAQLVIKDELEGVLREARATMIQQLEEKVGTCEQGIQMFEHDLKRVRTEKNDLEETNKLLKSQVSNKNDVEMLLKDAHRRDNNLRKDAKLEKSEKLDATGEKRKTNENKVEKEKGEKLVSRFEVALQKIDGLLKYLKKRNADLKRGDQIIPNLCKDEIAKQRQRQKEMTQEEDIAIKQITVECMNTKNALQEENEYMTLIVRDIRDEVLEARYDVTNEEPPSTKAPLNNNNNNNNNEVASCFPSVKDKVKKFNVDNDHDHVASPPNIKPTFKKNDVHAHAHDNFTGKIKKARHAFDATTGTLEEYRCNIIKELEEKLTQCERDKLLFESDLIRERNERAYLQESYKSLDQSMKDGLSEKSKPLLSDYERLLTKLVNQRKEMMFLFGFEMSGELDDLSFISSNAASNVVPRVIPRELEDKLDRCSREVDYSFNSLTLLMKTFIDCWDGIEDYYQDTIRLITPPSKGSRKIHDSVGDYHIESSLSSQLDVKFAQRDETMQTFVEKIKAIVKHAVCVDQILCETRRKSKTSIKAIRRLKSRLKKRKTGKVKKKYRRLFKRIKLAKKYGRSADQRNRRDYDGDNDDDVCRPRFGFGSTSLHDEHINLLELSGSLIDTEEKLNEALRSVKRCSSDDVAMGQAFSNDLSKNSSETYSTTLGNADADTTPGKSSVAQQDQRKYTVERLKFINKRFEVLLTCLKARAKFDEDSDTPESETDCNCMNDLLFGVRESFRPDDTAIKGAVDVLELAKGIRISDLDKLRESGTVKDEHLKILVLMKALSENRDSVLGTPPDEAEEKTRSALISNDNQSSHNEMSEEEIPPSELNVRKPGVLKLPPGFKRREKRLTTLLEGIKHRVDDLHGYLKQREEDMSGKNEHLTNLEKVFEDLKEHDNMEGSIIDATRDRIFISYENIKSELHEESVILQMIVEEVCEDIANLQKELTNEVDTHVEKEEQVKNVQGMCREETTLLLDKRQDDKSVNDIERERSILQRYINSVETSNKDLEDQLLYLTSENYKAKRDFAKTESLEEYNNMIQDLKKVEHLTASEEDELAFKTQLKKTRLDAVDVDASKDEPLDWQLSVKDGLSENNEILLSGYETLLRKLLQQRQETISIIGLDKSGQFKDISSDVFSSLDIEFKLASDIEANIREKSKQVESSFDALVFYLHSSGDDWSRIENCYRELSYCLEKIDSQDKDSCYNTDSNGSSDNEVIESDASPDWNNSRTFTYGFPSSTLNSKVTCKKMQKLINRIKALGKHVTFVDQKLIEMKHKSKRSVKVIRHLQMKLKQRKALECSNRNRILHLSKKLKMSKAYHNTCHNPTIVKNSLTDNLMTHAPFTKEQNKLGEMNAISGEVKLQALLLNDYSDKSTEGKFFDTPHIVKTSPRLTHDAVQSMSLGVSKPEYDADTLQKSFMVYQDQKDYMVEHLKFTNKRLEHLVNCFKGRERKRAEIECRNHDDEKEILKKAVDDILVCKQICVTELDDQQLTSVVDKSHVEIIVMLMKMNENMERILKESGPKAIVRGCKSESTFTLVSDVNSNPDPMLENDGMNMETASQPPTPVKINTAKTDSKLKAILEGTKQKIDDLAEYLTDREEDLKERGDVIAKFYEEFEELKSKGDVNCATTERVLAEYVKSKTMLEEENDFLQLFVTEVREELANLEKGFKMEAETQMHLNDFVKELQVSKKGLEQKVENITTELNNVKREKDYLLQSISLASMMKEYQGATCMNAPCTNICNKQFYTGCGYCAQNSESSVPPFSDEECPSTGSCEECESVVSDQDIFEVIWTPDATTCSRVAKNIKTAEAAEKIKSKNHPLSCLEKEIRPRGSPRSNFSKSSPCVASIDGSTSTVNKEPRVLGRRDSVRSGSLASSSFRSTTGIYEHDLASITSQESIATLQASVRQKRSYVDITAVDEFTLLDDDGLNEAEISPFINTKFDRSKKRKRKFLLFGKKWSK